MKGGTRMAKQNTLIDGIRGLSPTQKTLKALPSGELPKTVTVNFQGGQTGLLDMKARHATVWAKRLDFLQQRNRPVYVEIEPETNIITELLVPEISRVRSLTPIDAGDIEVTLIPSPAFYYLRSANPDFGELQIALETAKNNGTTVLVTWTRYKREIIDVRSLPEGHKDPLAPPETPPTPVDDPPTDPDTARDLFNQMNARSCDPCNATAPCIPFKYPTNGCYARAHEMCRLLIDLGEEPEKVWHYEGTGPTGGLTVHTSNDPDCMVGWWYHVAPTLNVEINSGTIVKWVIDPSMFNGPVSVEDWKNAQNDPTGTLEYSGPSIYFKDRGDPVGWTDADYSITTSDLIGLRLDLEDQCEDYGPSPYSCPINKRCIFVTDRSTFGEDEVQAMLGVASPAVIEAASYVIVDGYSPQELGITSFTPPNAAPAITDLPNVAGMSISATHLAGDYPDYLMRRQRLTWTYRVAFDHTNGFTEEVRSVALTASIAKVWDATDSVSDTAVIYLVRQPNPYEIDGETSWLSTDLRVFQIKEGQSKFGETMGGTPAAASDFIKDVIANLNNGTAGGQTFEDDISTDYQTSWLELSERVDEVRVFNFAIARVRYRGSALDAENVRVFFRLFPVSTTSLSYDQATTYRRGGSAGVVIPLLGIRGGELVTIPCFAEPRVDSSTDNLNDQTDPANVRNILHDAGGAERHAYFGCWLDINQLQDQFPSEPFPLDGPFIGERRTIQELIRGQHQCLVAEIAFDPNPIPDDATPSTSDKLAQRNLSVVQSANPGDVASHRIPLTFDIHPTPITLEAGEMADELMIDWGNTPDGSVAKMYMPGISTTDVLNLADEMYKVHRINRDDEHTLQCRAGGITYIPIPPGFGVSLAGLLTVDLPETVHRKQVFTIVVRQITNAHSPMVGPDPDAVESSRAIAEELTWRRILGSFQLTIPVRTKETMLEPERRLLSVLRWIQKAIPDDNRWYPVFRRYIGQIADRVDSLGGNSNEVAPSPSGQWKDPKAMLCKRLALTSGALLALSVVLLGVLSGGLLVTIGLLILALLIGVSCFWIIYCHPSECSLLRRLIAGVGSGAAVLALLAWLGVSTPHLITVLGISLGIIGIAALVGWVRRCL